MQRFVADVSSANQPAPLFQRVLDEDVSACKDSSPGWLAHGARIHLEPPPVRYPVLNTPPQGLCRSDASPPVRYPVFNAPAIAVSKAEATPPVRYPTFGLAPFDALRADAEASRAAMARFTVTELRDPNHSRTPTLNVWLGRGLSFGLHASVVAFVALFTSSHDAGDANHSNDTAGIEIALAPIASTAQEVAPPEPITEPVLDETPEEVKPEEVTPEEPKPLDTPILTTSNTHTEAVAPKIEETKAVEKEKTPPKPKPKAKPKPRPAAGGAPATQGSVNAYAAMVRARIASRKPGGGGLHGTATVSFAISGGGGLAYARVSHSSGSSSLDAMALQAVRSAGPFPAPPGGQRINMAIPFHFR